MDKNKFIVLNVRFDKSYLSYFRNVKVGFLSVLIPVDGNGRRKLKVFPSRVTNTGTMEEMSKLPEQMSTLP